jgi:hypothetical protein
MLQSEDTFLNDRKREKAKYKLSIALSEMTHVSIRDIIDYAINTGDYIVIYKI